MKKIIYIILAVVAGVQMISAQKSAAEIKGDKYNSVFRFEPAIQSYTEAGDKLSEEGVLNLAEACMAVRDFNQAVSNFEKLRQLRALTQEESYNYILSLKGAGRDQDGQNALQEFSALYPEDSRSVSFNTNRGDYDLIRNNDPHTSVEDMSFNSADADFGPAYLGEDLVFASTRKSWLFVKRNYNWNQKPYLNLYKVSSNSDQSNEVSPLNFKQNKKWHEASASFYGNGTKMAFTQSNYKEKSEDGESKLNIVFAEKLNGKWTNFKNFPLNNKDYSVGHPSITEDGNTMYFTSDMPGGLGGTDIYRIEKDADGNWGNPIHLGKEINTEANEMFPFWNESRQCLYFASNGHLGLGGLDVFVSDYYGDNNYEPVFNVGAPINSSSDDFGLIASADLTSGYFTSDRSSGKGDDDIYSFSDQKPDYLNEAVYEAYVLDSKSGKAIPDADVHLNSAVKQSDNTGKVQFSVKSGDYQVSASAVAYQPMNAKKFAVKVPRRGELTIRDTFYMDLIVKEKIVLENVYYDFDKWDIIPSAARELDKIAQLLNDNAGLRIELSAHTDTRGTNKYNMKLSQLRAESAKKYLVEKGIDSERIVAVGYGESQPVVSCKDADCTPTEHRQNRRTEIYIPDYGKGQDVIQTKGDYHDGSPDHGSRYSSSKEHGSIYRINP